MPQGLDNTKMALDMFGPDRILWGSDYPVSGNIIEGLNILDALGKQLKEKITCKNFFNLFK